MFPHKVCNSEVSLQNQSCLMWGYLSNVLSVLYYTAFDLLSQRPIVKFYCISIIFYVIVINTKPSFQ